jgi:hypothetical protein
MVRCYLEVRCLHQMCRTQNGCDLSNVSPVAGALGAFSQIFTPGSRSFSSTFVDSSSTLWLFGGQPSPPINVYTNDLWSYSPALNQWALRQGTSGSAVPANVGVQGVPVIWLPLSLIPFAHFSLAL